MLKTTFPFLLLLLLLSGAAGGAAQAQPQQEKKTRFENARILVDRGQFDVAVQELRPLFPKADDNEYSADALYLAAFASYRAGKLPEAEAFLNQLRDQHPQWPGLPDALYLHATVAFERNQPERALTSLRSIPDNELRQERQALKQHYLSRIQDRNQLAQLSQQFPADAEVGAAYANRVLATYTPADQQLLDQLIRTHRLDRSRYQPGASVKKPVYKVAVLFPFASASRNQFVTDLYEGIRYAADSLSQQGMRLELFSYEAGTDTVALKRLLQLPELQNMDLIIGPIYKSGSRIIARFANQYRIPVVNPLSEDGELLRASQLVYLFEPSVQTKARRLAEFAYTNFQPGNGLVIFENRREDSTLARLYRQEYERLGGKITRYMMVGGQKSAANTNTITKADTAGIGHIAVFSESPNVAASVMSLLESKDFQRGVLVSAAWLEHHQLSLEQLDAREIYFVSPHQTEPQTMRRFRQGYHRRTSLPPSVYAQSGFELLWQFGQALHQYGTNFGPALTQAGFRPGALYPGSDYSRGNDNGYVPLLKLEELRLLKANNSSSAQNFLPPPPPPPADERKQQTAPKK